MDRQEIIAELKNIIADYLKMQGLDLVDLILRQEGSGLILRILVDRLEGGITVGECANLNARISSLLDEKDILQTRYIMEVSSPGLDRALKTKNDFMRCVNRRTRFFLNESVNGKIELDGLISKVENDSVYIESRDEIVEIPLLKIARAKQIIS